MLVVDDDVGDGDVGHVEGTGGEWSVERVTERPVVEADGTADDLADVLALVVLSEVLGVSGLTVEDTVTGLSLVDGLGDRYGGLDSSLLNLTELLSTEDSDSLVLLSAENTSLVLLSTLNSSLVLLSTLDSSLVVLTTVNSSLVVNSTLALVDLSLGELSLLTGHSLLSVTVSLAVTVSVSVNSVLLVVSMDVATVLVDASHTVSVVVLVVDRVLARVFHVEVMAVVGVMLVHWNFSDKVHNAEAEDDQKKEVETTGLY